MKEEIKQFLIENSILKISRNNEANIRFSNYYQAVFKEEVCGSCPGKFNAAYDRLNNFINSNKKQIMTAESTFEMKKDVVVYDRISHKHYSNKNLTDKAAINLLSTNPKFKKVFTVLPDGWEGMVEQAKNNPSDPSSDTDPDQNPENFSLPSQVIDTEVLKEELFSLTKKTLQKRCKSMDLDPEQWGAMNRDELAQYLFDLMAKPAAE